MFLNGAELFDLTGYKRGAEQARWLRANGYYVETNARGVPRITEQQINERRALSQMPNTTAPATGPDVLAFRQKLTLSARH